MHRQATLTAAHRELLIETIVDRRTEIQRQVQWLELSTDRHVQADCKAELKKYSELGMIMVLLGATD